MVKATAKAMDSVRAMLGATRVVDPLERDAALAEVTARLFGRATAPTFLGRYRVLGHLGGGAQGVVYAGWDPALERRVAIKVLRVGAPDREATARLRREANALARLSDPHVIAVNDIGTSRAGLYVVMQLVPGRTLSEWLKTPRTWREIVDVLVQAGRGLVAAHGQGILHRDFKPSNVWIGDDGIARLLDFGLAQLAESIAITSSPDDELEMSQTLTGMGHVMGTPAYMAPEQHVGAELEPASDQYAFCVTAFEALYGARPFAAATLEALVLAKRTAVLPPAPRDTAVPARVRRVLERGLRFVPDARWPTMAVLVEALVRAASPRVHPRRVLLGAGVIAAGLASATWAWARERPAACSGAQALVDVWSGARRAELESAWQHTGTSLARDTAASVGAELDDFAGRWIASRDEACAALEHDPGADVRIQCLDRVRAQLHDTLSLLESPGPGVIEHAEEIVAELPEPHECAAEAGPAPDRRTPAVRRAIARARALGIAGHARVGTDAARRALEEARAVGDDGLVAQAELVHGNLLLADDDIAAASAELERAYLHATGSGHDDVAFEAGLALTGLYASHRQDLEACALWVERAAAALERGSEPADASARGRLELARAKQIFSAGRHADALPHAREAVELFQSVDDLRVCGAIDILAKLLANLGHYDEARAEAVRAIELARRLHGPRHPATAVALTTYAAMQAGPDSAEDALASLQEALSILLELRGDDDLGVAETRRRMGNALSQLGRKADAARMYRQALEVNRRLLPADDTKIAQSMYSLSLAVRALGDDAEAESLGRAALRISEATLGPDHPTTTIYVHGLAETLLSADLDEAAALLERGRASVGRRLGEEHHLYAAFLTSLAKHARARGDLDRARALLVQSLGIHDGPARGVDPEAREETSRELESIDAADEQREGV